MDEEISYALNAKVTGSLKLGNKKEELLKSSSHISLKKNYWTKIFILSESEFPFNSKMYVPTASCVLKFNL